MATYTAAEIKELTSQAQIAVWSDTKILLYQSMAETILSGLDLDTSVTDYSTSYSLAVVLLIDWLAQNPTGLQGMTKGKVTYTFGDLPSTVQLVLGQCLQGSGGTLTPATIERMDRGRR